MLKKYCIVCNKKKDFISRLCKFHSCQKCRDLCAMGYSIEETREMNGIKPIEEKEEYPFYRKYPNGYLDLIGFCSLDDLKEDEVLRMFKLLETRKSVKMMGFRRNIWKKPAIIIVPIQENPNWRKDFRSVNKVLSSNYICQ